MPQIRAFTFGGDGRGRLPEGLAFSSAATATLPTHATPFVDLKVGRRSGTRQSTTEHRGRRRGSHRRNVRSCCKDPRAQWCAAVASAAVVAIIVVAAVVVIIVFEIRHNRQLPAGGAPTKAKGRMTSSANLEQLESMEAALHGAQVDLISHEKRLRATVDGGAGW